MSQSRIVVKNLPGEVTEKQLLDIFGQKGTITHLDVKKNTRGKDRHFAFIGYHDDNSATEAIRSLNQTYINTKRIQVELCHARGYEKGQARGQKRKYPTDTKGHDGPKNKSKGKKKKKGSNAITDILVERYRTDPEFAEFLDLKSPEQAVKIRAQLNLPTEHLKKKNPSNSDSEQELPFKQAKLKRREILNLLYHVKMRNLPRKTNKTAIKEFFAPLQCKSVRIPKNAKGIAYIGFMSESDRVKALRKDKSILRGESVRIVEYNDQYLGRNKYAYRAPKSYKIYIYDLPSTTSEEDIEKLFSAYGNLKSVVLPKFENNDLKGFGLVTYENDSDAQKAYNELQRTAFSGKMIISPESNPEVPAENLEQCLQEIGESLDVGENENNSSKNKKWKNQEETLKNEESIAESGRIFLRNLSYTTQESDIENLFGAYGPISEVNLPIDPDTKQLKGFGIVTFLMPEHAVKAFTELDGTILHGRMLHLLPGKNKDTLDIEDDSNFKEKKLKNQKAQSNKSFNWNSLFVDHNAVAEVIAEKFGTSKKAVLGPEIKGSAAVRLALAETQIVNETKKYLEQMGVELDAFNESANVKRSKTVILVKNLPSKTDPKELKEIFGKHGQLGRVILPPSGLTAIIEFLDPSEARKAFTCLAYSKFKHVPLYLEWAPESSLKKQEASNNSNEDGEPVDTETKSEPEKCNNSDNDNIIMENDTTIEAKPVSIEGDPEPDTTLFVKNVNFKTNNDTLRSHFEKIGPLHYAYVVTRKINNSEDAPVLSRGYGFVRYMRKSDAERALTELNMSILDGKSLELAKSDRAEKNDSENVQQNSNNQSKLKIIVKNIPFAAKLKEVEEIFSTFGGLKRVRLPKKLGSEVNRHRGYAFVEFSDESNAKMAFDALHLSTHLLGRRLVLEWAKDDEDLDEIRKKTANHYVPQKKIESKKSVFKIN